jgi:hypothetical protein
MLHGSIAVAIEVIRCRRVHRYEKAGIVGIWMFVIIFLSDPYSQRVD